MTSKPVKATSMKNENGRTTASRLAVTERDAQHAEGHQQDVAGEHVGEETDGEREGPHEEGRDELDRRHQDVAAPSGTPGREQRVLEVLQRALVLDADADEARPRR